MPKISRATGSTSNVLEIFIQDSSSTTGAGLTGLLYTSPSLTAYYKRNKGTAAVQIGLADISVLGTWVSGGFKEISSANMPGVYEFDPPDASFAAGADSVLLMLRGATNMVPVVLEVELTAVNNQDAARFGMTNLDVTVSSRLASANFDKTGYSLTGAEHTLIETNVTNALTTQGYSTGRAVKLDNLDVTVGSRLASANFDKTGYALTSGEHTLIETNVTSGLTTQGYTGARATNLDNLDVTVGSRLASGSFIAPDNAGIAAIKVQTDKFHFDVDENVLAAMGAADKTGYSLASGGLDAVVVETGLNARQALAINSAALAGALQGGGTSEVVILSAGGVTPRITATVDEDGDRTTVTLTPPA